MKSREELAPELGDLRQFASVRRIMLDDGPERGVRALAFSTGGGLDFWALADRSLDIGPLWWRGAQIAWQGPNGFRSPQLHAREEDGGRGFERSLSGLLVTCGLTHIRQPSGHHPLHGQLPLTPARLLSYGEDWKRPDPVLFCEGEVTEATFHGANLRLHRRIEAPIGGRMLRIIDTVENLDLTPQPLAVLYHFNLGYPLVRPGTTVRHGGVELLRLGEKGLPPIACHDVAEQAEATCRIEQPKADGEESVSLSLSFGTAWLSHLQTWQDMRPHRRILGIEPATSRRLPDGSSGPAPVLAGRASADIRLSLTLATSRTGEGSC